MPWKKHGEGDYLECIICSDIPAIIFLILKVHVRAKMRQVRRKSYTRCVGNDNKWLRACAIRCDIRLSSEVLLVIRRSFSAGVHS